MVDVHRGREERDGQEEKEPRKKWGKGVGLVKQRQRPRGKRERVEMDGRQISIPTDEEKHRKRDSA